VSRSLATHGVSTMERHSRLQRVITGVTIALLLVAVLLMVILLFAPAPRRQVDQGSTAVGRLRAGQPAPDFHLASLKGGTVHLADYAGHPALINVWATWCVPCKQEMPAIQRAYERNQSSGFRVLAVNMMEQTDAIQAFAEKLNLSIPMAIDDGSFTRAYDVAVLPTSFLLDARGTVRRVQPGAMTDAMLDAMVRDVTKG